MVSVSLYVSVEVTLQTNADLRVGSMRWPAVQKNVPRRESEMHPLKAVSKKVKVILFRVSDVVLVVRQF